MLNEKKLKENNERSRSYIISRRSFIFATLLIFLILSIGAFAEIFYDSTQSCRRQNTGSWTNCSGKYPSATCAAAGDRLGCNDNINVQSSTTTSAATGLNMTDYNASELYCDSIQSVMFCYEWWANGATQTCSISVSNQSGANPTNIVTTCPGTTANPGVSCINVTTTKGWTCENFFGPTGLRATATATLYRSGSGTRTVTYDVFLFNVTYKKAPKVNLIAPSNGATLNNSNVTFQCNGVYDKNLANVTLYFNYSGSWAANETQIITGTNVTANFSKTLMPSNIIWNCQFCAVDGNCKFAPANWTLQIIDNTPPVINSISDYPDPVAQGNNITFVANVTDNFGIGTVRININGTNYTMIQNTTDTWYYVLNTSTYSPGTYNYTVYANDTSGNNATPMTGNFTVIVYLTPSIYTDKTTYGMCNNIYFKVSVYDVNDQLIDTTLNNGLLDATNTTVYNESVTTGNGGSSIYLGVIAIPSGYNSGNWILRAISGNIKAQKALNVS